MLLAGCGGDDEPAGYYLRGRTFDAVSLEPVAAAELTLLSGKSTAQTTSDENGFYTVGPIPAGTTYQVRATAKGMSMFEFTGEVLPPIESGGDRTLVGDVALYDDSKKTPAFKIVLHSADRRVGAQNLDATISFTPTLVGTDPSFAATLGTPRNSADISGSYVQPAGDTLPNHMQRDAKTFRAEITTGEVEIPEDALSWGATYSVTIDAGSSFTPVEFMLTPVRDTDVEVVVQPVLMPGDKQLPDNVQQYFTGRIYDGVSLGRIVDFSMRLEYFDRILNATVGSDGRYVVGPLLPNADYTVAIEADGYRSFLSHNKSFAATMGSLPLESKYFDAFLYPENVKSPAVQMRFSAVNQTTYPSGSVRFAPKTGSSLFDTDLEKPAGVDNQRWVNDEDLQQRAVVKEFKDGVLELEEGELVLGVQYAVTVFGVGNYAIQESANTYTAGVDANPSFVLQPLTEAPLSIVGMSNAGNVIAADATLEIRFNHLIALSVKTSSGTLTRALNDNFDIDSPDRNMDGNVNQLVDPASLTEPIAPAYRGVTFEVVEDRLILHWSRKLDTKDTKDPINSVIYGGLQNIVLHSATLPTSPAATLSSLLNSNSVVVQTTAL